MSDTPRVGLFATCLVDLMRPAVGFATAALLQRAGCTVEVPQAQTCCGQPAFNNGDDTDARSIAKQVIAEFEGFDYVVAPSGSCIGMLREHYPALFADEPEWQARAQALAERCYELTAFLVDVRRYEPAPGDWQASVTYHDSCSGLRELGIKHQPRTLLQSVRGLELLEMQDAEVCCGFGGTFCVKYPEVSVKMASDKLANAERTGAGTLLGGDLGCLLNLAGRAQRLGKPLRVRHVAEVLAGMTDAPAIGEPD